MGFGSRIVVVGFGIAVACNDVTRGDGPDAGPTPTGTSDSGSPDESGESSTSGGEPPPSRPDGVETLDPPPPPIAGGTLALSRDGARLFVADPDRDAVYVVDRASATLTARIALPVGSEPGRVIEDHAGLVHVALRHAGLVATIDPVRGTLSGTRRACANPRGLGAPEAGGLLIACADGELIHLADDGTRVVMDIGTELRDVVDPDPPIRVSTFRDPRVLTLDASGAITHVDAPPILGASAGNYPNEESEAAAADGHLEPGTYAVPNTARRTIALPGTDAKARFGSSWVMLHQAAATRTLDVSFEGYAADDCVPVQATVLTYLGRDGVVHSSLLEDITVPLDVAVTADGERAAIVSAMDGGVVVFVPEVAAPRDGIPAPCPAERAIGIGGAPIGVVFAPDGHAWVQRREPAALVVVDPSALLPESVVREVVLDAESRYDTGHDVFHRPTQFGLVACASCHPEGRDDAMTWTFERLGPRRTQSLDTMLAGSEPLHWRGELDDFDTLVNVVHRGRMAGTIDMDAGRALAGWVQARTALAISDDDLDIAAAERGREMFTAIGCATCHAGTRMSNDATVEVPRRGWLQVPGLLGVDYRGPWMHDGRAKTLDAAIDEMLELSDPGAPEGLSTEARHDLVEYLRSVRPRVDDPAE